LRLGNSSALRVPNVESSRGHGRSKTKKTNKRDKSSSNKVNHSNREEKLNSESASGTEATTSASAMSVNQSEADEGGEAVSTPDCPPSFLCSMNKHIMKNPVKTPEGLYYERDTIMLWLEKYGNTCPINKTPLQSTQLVADKELQMKITEWHIVKTMDRNKLVLGKDDDFDEENLYEF
jgi:hypothetical protein